MSLRFTKSTHVSRIRRQTYEDIHKIIHETHQSATALMHQQHLNTDTALYQSALAQPAYFPQLLPQIQGILEKIPIPGLPARI